MHKRGDAIAIEKGLEPGHSGTDCPDVRSNEPCMQPANLDAVTSLRFIAAFSIVILHAQAIGIISLFSDIKALHALGQGVAFFFTLSGFVLAYRYKSIIGWDERSAYFCNRVARILPLYYIAGLPYILIPGLHHFSSPPGADCAVYALALQDWLRGTPFHLALNPPAHSISSECFFYLVFAFLAALKPKSKLIVPICIAPFLLLLGQSAKLLPEVVLNMAPVMMLYSFCAGVIAEQFLPRFQRYGKTISRGNRKAFWMFTITEILLFLSAAATSYLIAKPVPLNFSVQLLGLTMEMVPLIRVIQAAAFAAILVLFSCPQGAVSRLLEHRHLVLLGAASYAIFLTHYPVIMLFDLLKASLPPQFLNLFGFFAIATILPLSIILYRYVEDPSRKLIVQASKEIRERLKRKADTNFSDSTSPAYPLRRTIAELFLRAALPALFISVTGSLINDCIQLEREHNRDIAKSHWNNRDNPVVTGSSNILFADSLEMVGAKFLSEHGKTLLCTKWKARKNIGSGSNYLATHIADGKGNILRNLDHKMTAIPREVKAGTDWIDEIVLPDISGAADCALAIYNEETKLCSPISGGRTDWNQRRLLLSLPK